MITVVTDINKIQHKFERANHTIKILPSSNHYMEDDIRRYSV